MGTISDAVDREEVHRLEKPPVILALGSTPGPHLAEDIDNQIPVLFGHLRQHGRLPLANTP